MSRDGMMPDDCEQCCLCGEPYYGASHECESLSFKVRLQLLKFKMQEQFTVRNLHINTLLIAVIVLTLAYLEAAYGWRAGV